MNDQQLLDISKTVAGMYEKIEAFYRDDRNEQAFQEWLTTYVGGKPEDSY